MAEDFLGRGWAFPVEADRAGAVRTADGADDVEQAIRLILGTCPGERVMRPDFGCGIDEFAFAAVDTTTLTLIEETVEDALVTWEPRIEVRSVDAELVDPERGRLEVAISYRVRSSNTEHNLVYPYYLGGDRR